MEPAPKKLKEQASIPTYSGTYKEKEMATGGLPSVFECAVCLHSMLDRTPRGLPCLHSFCEECLRPLIKNGEIICPSCRKIVEIKGNDVKELPVNFLLYQIKDMSTHGEAKDTLTKSESCCDICKKEDPKRKCEDCSKQFCLICEKKHSNIKKYADHMMYDLCTKHADSTHQYLCKECLDPLCKICLAEHSHEPSIIDYGNAVKEYKEGISKIKEDVNLITMNYDKLYEKNLEKSKVTNNLLHDLEERKVYYADKVKETDELIEITEDKIAAFKDFEVKYEKDRFQCEELLSTIEALEVTVPNFSHLPHLKLKAAETVKDVEQHIQIDYSLPPFVLYKHSAKLLAVPRATIKVPCIEKERLLFTLEKWNGVGFLTLMACIGKDILMVTKNNLFLKINSKGEMIKTFCPEIPKGEVKGISFFNGQLYIAQEKLITVVSLEKMEIKDKLQPNISEISDIYVKNSNKILLSEHTKNGSVLVYRPMEDEIETVVAGLNGPRFVGVFYKEIGQHYIVSNTWEHCVNIYNRNWKLQQTIGVKGIKGAADHLISFPMAVAVTEYGTLLIADYGNKRVSHFSSDGKFISHLLTQNDGIGTPVNLRLQNNVLYICNNHGHIKCFQLKTL